MSALRDGLSAADRIAGNLAALQTMLLPEAADAVVWEIAQDLPTVRGTLIAAVALLEPGEGGPSERG